MPKVSRRRLAATLVFAASRALAQVSAPSIVPVTVSPAGNVCTANTPLKLLVPGGVLFACQNGLYGAVGAGSSGAVTYNQGSTGAVNRTATSKLQESFSVLDFGAKCDGSTDDTAAFTAAMTAANRSAVNCGLGSTAPTASCTSAVLVPNAACVFSQLNMLNNVKLVGTGWMTSVLVQKAGANENFITNASPSTNQRFSIEDLFINGNASSQTGSSDCVHFDSTGSLSDSTRSPRHTLQNVFVANCKQDAISLQGDAGSEYLLNAKGMNSGRYGLNMNVFDSHVDVGEFASNGTAGVFLGTNGNGSIEGVKSWGNGGAGTAVGNAGFVVNSGNYRFANDEAQDNSCNGWYLVGVTDTSFDAVLADGNGPTGGGSSCAGWVFSGSSKNTIHGNFRGVTDAGWSDYAINWIGTNNNNDVTLIIDNPHVGPYLGTLGNNNLHSDTQDISSAAHTLNNGAVQRGYSDNQTTQTYSLDASTGIANYQKNQVAAGGNAVYSCGGPNNFDFANFNFIGLTFGASKYSYTEGQSGTCPAAGIPLLYNEPVQLNNGFSEAIAGIASAATIAPATGGIYHVTGSTPISTITPWGACTGSLAAGYACHLALIFDAAAPLATGGNIIRAVTPAAGQMFALVYDPGTSLWYSQ